MTFLLLSVALLLDRLVGDPDWLWRRIKHPVAIFGAAISFFERRFNRPSFSDRQKRNGGIASIAILLVVSAITGLLIHRLFATLGLFGLAAEILVVAIFLAQKSLSDHVQAVAAGLRAEGLEGGRRAVAMIVGRDPASLDEPAVCRASIETLAENFSDGVIAPALFYLAFGLPGLLAYKMLNTADSMIGHKSPRYLHFGWAAARLDDLANWPAARLSMFLIAAGAAIEKGFHAARNAIDIAMSDHGLHRSPNSGWPEAAMAGALDITLAGPRLYAGERVQEPMLNGAGRQNARVGDIETGIKIFQSSCTVFNVLVPACLALYSVLF